MAKPADSVDVMECVSYVKIVDRILIFNFDLKSNYSELEKNGLYYKYDSYLVMFDEHFYNRFVKIVREQHKRFVDNTIHIIHIVEIMNKSIDDKSNWQSI